VAFANDVFENARRVKHWEIIADNLSTSGWSRGCVSAVDSEARTIWIFDAHRGDGKRFVVRSEEKLTAFGGIRIPKISHAQASAEPVAACQARPYKLRSNSATVQSSLFSAPTTSQNFL